MRILNYFFSFEGAKPEKVLKFWPFLNISKKKSSQGSLGVKKSKRKLWHTKIMAGRRFLYNSKKIKIIFVLVVQKVLWEDVNEILGHQQLNVGKSRDVLLSIFWVKGQKP